MVCIVNTCEYVWPKRGRGQQRERELEIYAGRTAKILRVAPGSGPAIIRRRFLESFKRFLSNDIKIY